MRKLQQIYGKRIAPPRLTYGAVGLALLYVGLPVILLGLALDFVVYWLFGMCTGLVCVVI